MHAPRQLLASIRRHTAVHEVAGPQPRRSLAKANLRPACALASIVKNGATWSAILCCTALASKTPAMAKHANLPMKKAATYCHTGIEPSHDEHKIGVCLAGGAARGKDWKRAEAPRASTRTAAARTSSRTFWPPSHPGSTPSPAPPTGAAVARCPRIQHQSCCPATTKHASAQ